MKLRLITIILYLGIGGLTHWLWLGDHFDPANVFGWACVGAWIIMLPTWIFLKAMWVFVTLAIVAILAAIAIYVYDTNPTIRRWRVHRAMQRKKATRMSAQHLPDRLT